MKIHGITRAVEEFNHYRGICAIWQNPSSGEVFARTYKDKDSFTLDLDNKFICLEIKGISGRKFPCAMVTIERVENDVRAFSVGTDRYDYSI